MSHIGSCFCGAVKLEVIGSPEAMGYCHCSSCRSWSGGPVNAFSLWKPDAVRIRSGAEHVATYQKTKMSQRKYCSRCGGHLMTDHPPIGRIIVDPLLCIGCKLCTSKGPDGAFLEGCPWDAIDMIPLAEFEASDGTLPY